MNWYKLELTEGQLTSGQFHTMRDEFLKWYKSLDTSKETALFSPAVARTTLGGPSTSTPNHLLTRKYCVECFRQSPVNHLNPILIAPSPR